MPKRKPKPPAVRVATAIVSPPPLVELPTLQGIRDKTVRDRLKARETIAGIEAWIEEARATIAFLKARSE
jgi:hypothetical protein